MATFFGGVGVGALAVILIILGIIFFTPTLDEDIKNSRIDGSDEEV